jgi:hypothetical protein
MLPAIARAGMAPVVERPESVGLARAHVTQTSLAARCEHDVGTCYCIPRSVTVTERILVAACPMSLTACTSARIDLVRAVVPRGRMSANEKHRTCCNGGFAASSVSILPLPRNQDGGFCSATKDREGTTTIKPSAWCGATSVAKHPSCGSESARAGAPWCSRDPPGEHPIVLSEFGGIAVARCQSAPLRGARLPQNAGKAQSRLELTERGRRGFLKWSSRKTRMVTSRRRTRIFGT